MTVGTEVWNRQGAEVEGQRASSARVRWNYAEDSSDIAQGNLHGALSGDLRKAARKTTVDDSCALLSVEPADQISELRNEASAEESMLA